MLALNFKKTIKNLLHLIILLSLVLTPIFHASYADAAPDIKKSVLRVAGGALAGFITCKVTALGAKWSEKAVNPTSLLKLLFVPVSDKDVETAQDVQTLKECGLDTAANVLKQEAIRTIMRDLTNWINGGFAGDPFFVQNFTGAMIETVDRTVGEVIYNNEYMNHLCGDFDLPLRFALNIRFSGKSGSLNAPPRCTATEVVGNIEDELKSLNDYYSWGRFLDVTTKNNNNPFGLYIDIASDIDRVTKERTDELSRDLETNDGYFSDRVCDKEYIERKKLLYPNISDEKAEKYDGTPYGAEHCKLVTPGAQIAAQATKVLGTDIDQILLADEFDEMLTALFNQFINKLTSKVGGNDRGLYSFRKDNDLNNYGVAGRDEQLNALLDDQKDSLKSQYDTRSYNIGIKILQSQKKTLQNANSIVSASQLCWEERDSGLKAGAGFLSDQGMKGLVHEYTNLTEATVDDHLNYHKNPSIIDRINNETKLIDLRIGTLIKERDGIEGIEKFINSADSLSELSALTGNLDMKGVSLTQLTQEKLALEQTYEAIINGSVEGFDNGTFKTLKKGGVSASSDYCQSFYALDRPEDTEFVSYIFVDSVVDHNELINENEIKIADTYNPESDITNLQIEIELENFEEGEEIPIDVITGKPIVVGDNDGDDNTGPGFVSSTGVYKKLIDLATPSRAGSLNITTFLDFFNTESFTNINGSDYIAWVKAPFSGSESSSFYNLNIDKQLYYPDGLAEGKIIDRISGTGGYCTDQNNSGKSFVSYKVFLPSIADKFAILFKPEDGVLHRAHITYKAQNSIDHRNVKPLIYSENGDSDHIGLREFFVEGKTALLNLKYRGLLSDLDEPGITMAGIVLGKNEIEKYVTGNGAWMYIDIAQDLDAAGSIEFKQRDLQVLYYTGIDRQDPNYQNYIVTLNPEGTEEKNIGVINQICQ